ncbi:spermidine/putrescine ABC transporter substrate-binding protein [Rhodopseudomonas palustris]|uniref:Spermidine/putrescine ABC transporter substrate-binding protein n=1 Tax=Rhodopseudomonas palustris TaxID=1076 RepID=A0A0D7F3Y8_RHOPL|nr:spermidine/putrescine ABC transporter substrate-binding protein [Rhodopseudomonas palustris]
MRWLYLSLSIICMIMIANLQYGWSVFVAPMQHAHNWAVTSIQVAFTIFVALETWATPVNALICDRIGPRFGPRLVMGAGGILVAAGWVLDAYTSSLTALYIGGALTGFGAGAIYCVSVGTAVKWFPDRRGLATGLVAAGFGAGAALTIIPIKMHIAAYGYESAFLLFGLIQGGVVLVASQFIRHPNPGEVKAVAGGASKQSLRSYTSKEVLGSWVFWVLYVCDVLMCAGGLVVTANLVSIANSHNISTVMILGVATLSLALVFANVMNGVARPLFGWIADQIGLPKTMMIGFSLGAVAYFCLFMFGGIPAAFVLCTGLVFFCWGNIFSLFPAMCTNLFGTKYATTNASLLYTAKGTAALLVPLASIVTRITGSWDSVLLVATVINVIAVFVVGLILTPAAKKFQSDEVAADAALVAKVA